MILSERLTLFHDRLRSKQAVKAECASAVDWCIEEGRYLEAVYILDLALMRFSSSRYFHQRITNLLGKMDSDGAIDGALSQLPDNGNDLTALYNKLREKFTPIHGPGSPRPGGEAFLKCVVLKNMCMLLDKDQPIWNVLLRFAEHFGGKSAREAFGQSATSAVVNAGIAKIGIGGSVLRYYVPNTFMAFGLQYFFLNEPGLLRLIAQFREGDVFLDIGANIGCFAIAAAVTKGCHTFAVEPFSVNYTELLRNISLNGVDGRVTPLPIAISDRTGEGPLSFRSDYVGAAAQAFDDRGENGTPKPKGVEWVQGYRLDDFIAEGRTEFPTHIKIDVDGTEHRIIAGMPETLADRRLRAIRLEIRVEDPRNAEALRKIETAGFSCKIDDDTKNLLCLRV